MKCDDGNRWPFWRHLVEDFERMAAGEEVFARDADGTVFTFALLYCKSDEQERCDTFGLAHFSAVSEICSECLCNRSCRPYTDLRECASWRMTEEMDFETYALRHRRPAHPLASSAFFCHRGFFVLDLMHLVDCRGVAALTYGGALMYLLSDPRLGSDRADRLQLINDRRAEHYTRRPNVGALPTIHLSNLQNQQWGELHGRAFRAAIMRHASPLFRERVGNYCTGSTARDVLLRSVVGRLDDVYTVLYSSGMWLDDAALRTLRAH